MTELRVNGTVRATASSPVTPLLRVLRDELGLTGAKPGCEQGGCGACTVLIDGEPRRACLTAVGTVEDREITTVEGLGTPRRLSPIQAAFNEHYAAQCGYCTSGMMLAAAGLLRHRSGPVHRADVEHALGGHVCRCTGYIKIIDAVIAASQAQDATSESDGAAPDATPTGAQA